jgi:inorganic pyrophosphatase
MRDITKLSHELDRESGICLAIIETPKGKRGKFSFDPDTGLFCFKKLLPEGMSFPLDFGFVPSTLCDDGDPIDVMVLCDEPSFVGALFRVRLIGVLEAEEREAGAEKLERNDRLIAIPTVSHLYAHIRSASELERPFIDHLSDFWVHKAKLEGASFNILGVKDAPAAITRVVKAAKVAKKKHK